MANGTITTYSGRSIDPLDPDIADIDIVDIAHALSQNCRFTGHTSTFYSVAQHCVLVSEIVEPKLRLTALLHDAAEAYLSDLASPIKQRDGLGEVYRAVESSLETAIAKRYGLVYPYPKEVKEADDILLRTEQRDLMPDDIGEAVVLDTNIIALAPTEAEALFLDRFQKYESA